MAMNKIAGMIWLRVATAHRDWRADISNNAPVLNDERTQQHSPRALTTIRPVGMPGTDHTDAHPSGHHPHTQHHPSGHHPKHAVPQALPLPPIHSRGVWQHGKALGTTPPAHHPITQCDQRRHPPGETPYPPTHDRMAETAHSDGHAEAQESALVQRGGILLSRRRVHGPPIALRRAGFGPGLADA
jgi:hypothetical protein